MLSPDLCWCLGSEIFDQIPEVFAGGSLDSFGAWARIESWVTGGESMGGIFVSLVEFIYCIFLSKLSKAIKVIYNYHSFIDPNQSLSTYNKNRCCCHFTTCIWTTRTLRQGHGSTTVVIVGPVWRDSWRLACQGVANACIVVACCRNLVPSRNAF